MKNITIAAAMMALSAPLLAQGSMTTPSGGLATEGCSHAHAFGWYRESRYQLIDDTHTGGKGATITQIAFRSDHRNHAGWSAMGRTWSLVTLDISETTNYHGLSITWSQNITTTPTRVFASKWSWPTLSGFPLLKPDIWGGVTGQLRFPFTKPWSYTAEGAILMDYLFRGGTLANNQWWSTARPADYYLDSGQFNCVKHGTATQLPELPSTCSDSAFMAAPYPGAVAYGHAHLHPPGSLQPRLRNKLQLEHYSLLTAPNAPVVHFLGLGGFPAGVSLGARCHRLHVDFSKPVALFQLKTQRDLAYTGIVGWEIPWDNMFSDAKVYIQAAWADSKTNALGLTVATRLTLPDGPSPPAPPRYRTFFNFRPDGPYAYPHLLSDHSVFPYTQYKTK